MSIDMGFEEKRIVGIYNEEYDEVINVFPLDIDVDVAHEFKQMVYEGVVQEHEKLAFIEMGLFNLSTGNIVSTDRKIIIKGVDLVWEEIPQEK